MKRMNRVIYLGLALAMCFSLLSSAYAVEEQNSNVISFEDYYKALKAEYAKYNMNLEILDHNDSFVYTQEFLDEKIASLNSYMETADFDKESGTFLDYNYEETTSENNTEGQSILGIMPNTRDYTLYPTVNATGIFPGSAELEIRVNVTEDVSSGVFMSINSVTSRQYGTAVNFESWTQTSHTVHIISNYNSLIYGVVHGTLVAIYTEPKTGNVIRNTSDHDLQVSIDCEA